MPLLLAYNVSALTTGAERLWGATGEDGFESALLTDGTRRGAGWGLVCD